MLHKPIYRYKSLVSFGNEHETKECRWAKACCYKHHGGGAGSLFDVVLESFYERYFIITLWDKYNRDIGFPPEIAKKEGFIDKVIEVPYELELLINTEQSRWLKRV